jgi:hypothetical protein
MPELTIRMAHHMTRILPIRLGETVLDYGCAKGYLVKALRLLDINAFGCDISSYAIKNVDDSVKRYCEKIPPELPPVPFPGLRFSWIVTKDVLEHMSERDIHWFLSSTAHRCDSMFHVIPLGDGCKFTVPEYERDTTHVTAWPADKWISKFRAYGWNNITYGTEVMGIKELWTSLYETGNGFFWLRRR